MTGQQIAVGDRVSPPVENRNGTLPKLALGPAEQAIAAAAADVLGAYDHLAVEQAQLSLCGYNEVVWHEFRSREWTTLVGGGAAHRGNHLKLVVLYEELGRTLCPLPHWPSSVLAGGLLRLFESDRAAAALQAVLAGSSIATAAYLEAGHSTGLCAGGCRIEGDRLSGVKRLVRFADQAEQLVIVLRESDQYRLCLVPQGSEGLALRPLRGLDRGRQSDVVMASLPVAPEDQVVVSQQTLVRALFPAALALSAASVGAAQAALDATVHYVSGRIAFDHPIGSFQAIQHRLADLVTEITAARTMVRHAAWALDGRDEQTWLRVVTGARLFSSEVFRDMAYWGLHYHGGIGFAERLGMPTYFRHAKHWQLELGGPQFNEELMAVAVGLDGERKEEPRAWTLA